ncbi:MAG: alpha-2-macroglobulin family protein [Desulfobulbaceae bacterium]|jgi:uncharacterized protein YfaS (alpha-2-macroglobulin family)|nr:alpha-2-macroglobulin family protein [Desulfobulbaceae bacterium]
MSKPVATCLVFLALIFCSFLVAATSAGAATLADLKKESAKVGARLVEKAPPAELTQTAYAYFVSGQALLAEKEYDLAFKLFRQAIRSGYPIFNDEVWEGLGDAAAGSWDRRQQDAANYYALACDAASMLKRSPERQAALLLKASAALAHRGADWSGVEMDVYREIEKVAAVMTDKDMARRYSAIAREKLAWGKRLDLQGQSWELGERPQLCLRFNDQMKPDTEVDYRRYLLTQPDFKAAFHAKGDTICLSGADYGVAYAITLRQGLKGVGKEWPEEKNVQIAAAHRAAAVWFAQNDYLLPIQSDGQPGAVPLFSVNAEKASIVLYRIGERNLATPFVRSNFQQKLDADDLNQIIKQYGELVWQGEAALAAAKADAAQRNLVTIPPEFLAQPGLYVLGAGLTGEKRQRWENGPTQWLAVTDIGLTAYHGGNGLWVMARSLRDGNPLPGQEISLYARNNQLLATVRADASGLAHFPAGLLRGQEGKIPEMVTATSGEHGFSLLRLAQAPFDLSDRGVSGRPPAAPLDGYIYTDRGIYRPGETAHVVALLRDDKGKATTPVPLTLRLYQPDGKEQRQMVVKAVDGAYVQDISLPPRAHDGEWQVKLFADTASAPVAATSFQMRSFLPPRLEVSFHQPDTAPTAGSVINAARLHADYLFGAPGAGLRVTAQQTPLYDPHPFAAYQEFFFGNPDGVQTLPTLDLAETLTDATGGALITPLVDQVALQSVAGEQSLKVRLDAEVMDVDGRVVAAQIFLPLRQLGRYVGLKPGFNGNRAAADSPVGFSLVSLGRQGEAKAGDALSCRLFQEDVDYQWFEKNGQWSYERLVDARLVAEATVTTAADGTAHVNLPVASGPYFLDVSDATGKLLARHRFMAGERLAGVGDRPDMVKVSLDKSLYRSGEVAKLKITPPWDGKATLALADESFHFAKNFAVSGAGAELEIPVGADWGAGRYAIVTVYRPGKDGGAGANRAVGLVWLAVEPTAERLTLRIDAPEKARPRARMTLPVTVQGGTPSEKIHLTLAAVDEGVLRLTNFPTPDPLGYFFGKRRLGLAIRDVYGNLIEAGDGKPAILRHGASDDGGRGGPERNIKIVSLFSGVVMVGADGKAEVPLTLPDFAGRLRLMAVAWTADQVGAAESAVTVNEPVAFSPSLPRFLAVGDQSFVNVLLHNIDGPEGEYQVRMTAGGAVVGGGQERIVLARGERRALRFPLKGQGVGHGGVKIELTGPQSYAVAAERFIGVRATSLPALKKSQVVVAAGAVAPVDVALFQGINPASAELTLAVSNQAPLDVAALLDELDRYPYGCLEQTTSRAMPLLYFNELAGRWGLTKDANLDQRLNEAIARILQNQLYTGAFSLWGGTEADAWLSAYAMDFLRRAKEKGFFVADYSYNAGLKWLDDEVRGGVKNDNDLPALAYAHYVLAAVGRGRREDAAYLLDTYLSKIHSPLAVAQLAVALTLTGDADSAQKGFAAAEKLLVFDADKPAAGRGIFSYANYGSRLRDLAACIALLHDDRERAVRLWPLLIGELGQSRYHSTQEQGWLALAALDLPSPEKPLQVRIDGQDFADADHVSLRFTGEKGKGVVVENKGAADVWLTVNVYGDNLQPPLPQQDGIMPTRSWFYPDGAAADLSHLKQGDLLVEVIDWKETLVGEQQLLVAQLLPAGIEYEKAIDENARARFPWLPNLTPALYTDGLDDRFIAAFATNTEQSGHGRGAYLLRVVTPGDYALPGLEIESMYAPQYRGRTASGDVHIDEAR